MTTLPVCSCGHYKTMGRASVLACGHCDRPCDVRRCGVCANLSRAPGRGPSSSPATQ